MRAGVRSWVLVFGLVLSMSVLAQGCGDREDAYPTMVYRAHLEDKGQLLEWLLVDTRGNVLDASVDECRWVGLRVHGLPEEGQVLAVKIEGVLLELYVVVMLEDVTGEWKGGVRW